MKDLLKELMYEVDLEEMENLQGSGYSAAQCAWMALSCVNYIPGVGFGCGGYSACELYKRYC
ncbi:MAG: sublancin family glycopeptide [Bacillaceae bacterium]|uniref:pallidocin n=1 Tax=Aeribacillus TaxID=1055323 RepID=UPI0007B49969|nr:MULTISPECIES: pallidocin [Aeribacillus]KZM53253.1 pallidocin [Aeribacillus pallidus]MED0651872.1 pallidocin [Aeribacillus composti]MED4485654.1 pallidocin [Aeribacillus pallidus]REJ20009.1 MAG: sublancin family glycopeptide [Bacillaceae bacterium]